MAHVAGATHCPIRAMSCTQVSCREPAPGQTGLGAGTLRHGSGRGGGPGGLLCEPHQHPWDPPAASPHPSVPHTSLGAGLGGHVLFGEPVGKFRECPQLGTLVGTRGRVLRALIGPKCTEPTQVGPPPASFKLSSEPCALPGPWHGDVELGQGHGMGTWSQGRDLELGHSMGTWSWDGDMAWGPGAGPWHGDMGLGQGPEEPRRDPSHQAGGGHG